MGRFWLKIEEALFNNESCSIMDSVASEGGELSVTRGMHPGVDCHMVVVGGRI